MLILALKTLRRDWRSGELRVLALALLIAVASVAAVAAFTDRVRLALERQSSELLGGDLVINASDDVSPEWAPPAHALGLTTARVVNMRSVVVYGEQTLLVEAKAVGVGYPLRGQLQISQQLLGDGQPTRDIPALGTAWADAQLMQNLNLKLGDEIELGQKRLRLSHVLTYEPDRGGDLFNLAPRLMINLADLPATELIQPGSRVNHRLLLAGDAEAVAQFQQRYGSQLDRENLRLLGVRDARPELRQALERAERFLGLASLVSVMLAGVGIAIAARRFSLRHYDSVAVLRCFGVSSRQVLQLFAVELLLLGVLTGALGVTLGYVAQYGLSWLLAGVNNAALPNPSSAPAVTALLAGLLTLLGFTLPPLLQLKNVPPLRVLRRDLAPLSLRRALDYGPGLLALLLLIAWQAQDWKLALVVSAGCAVSSLVLALVARGLMRVLSQFRSRVGLSWRFGLANVTRRSASSSVQVVALGLGIMVLLVLTVVRADLLQAWQKNLPPEAPNHFLINIQPNEVQGVEQFLQQQGLKQAQIYPMVRGRLVKIGERAVSAADYTDQRAQRLVEREFNLSWTQQLAAHNQVVAGQWWDSVPAPEAAQASVEQGIAETLGIKLGDTLHFQVAGQTVAATVSNLRSVEWDSFQVNFFVTFSPGVLEQQPSTWITSVHLNPEQKRHLAELVHQYPSVTIIDIDALMNKVRQIIQRVAYAVQYVFLFTLLAGLSVLYAALQATQDERRYEAAMLRTLGARSGLVIRSLLSEFVLLGAVAGVLGAVLASVLGWVLARVVFDFPYQLDWLIMLIGLVLGAVGVGLAGWLGTRSVLATPPLRTLRA